MAEKSTGGADKDQDTTVKQPWENLGYDSFEAYQKALTAEKEKLQKQVEERQAMIDRQANEIGKLRKDVESIKESSPKTDQETPPASSQEDKEAEEKRVAEARLKELAITMTAEQRAKVNEALKKDKKDRPEAATLAKNDPTAKLVYIQHVLGEEEMPEPDDDIFQGLIPEKKESAAERLQRLLKGDSNLPPAPSPGRGVPPRTSREGWERKPVPPALRYDAKGGVMNAIKQIEKEKEKG